MIARVKIPVTIASGQTVSPAVDLYGYDFVALEVPTMTGASFTVQGSADGVTYSTIKDSAGAAVTITHGAPSIVLVNSVHFNQFPRFIKLVSNLAEGADRVIGVLGSIDAGS